MLQVSYDGTFEGLLSAIFEVYERKLEDVAIVKEKAMGALSFGEDMSLVTVPDKARRVWSGLEARLSPEGLRTIYWSYLSEIKGIENIILEYCRYAFSSGVNIEDNFGHAAVIELSQTVKKVGREAHRFEAFVRFEKIGAGLYYAPIEPDYNILPIIATHYKNRYADQDWIIYDTRRKYGIHYNRSEGVVSEITLHQGYDMQEDAVVIHDPEEEKYSSLWQHYFKATNIAARKNTKLHLKHVPKRYWKYLTEKRVG